MEFHGFIPVSYTHLSDGEVHTAEEALEVADRIGYPVMLKASAGGGGKGIRKVERAEDLVPAFESASTEAKAAFGNGAMYLELSLIHI